ncbi:MULTISPECIES: helix-turn-helix domain-containing protein [unclassified Paenibacillus]|uniref:helix-turn-helix domain-containing protein n=1 Tax=unclassified Paenibacillus TaxID=185978 RepID=UPI0036443748
MSRFDALRQKKYLSRIIIFGCISACIPIILIGSVYYHFAMKSAMENIVNDAKASLLISKDRVERIFQNLELDSYSIASSPIVTSSMYDQDFTNNVLGHGEINEMLDKKKNSNDFIVDIVYYNSKAEGAISNNYGYIPERFYKDNQDLRTAMSWEASSKWGYLPYSGKKGYLTFVRQLPVVNGNNKNLGALLIHADTREIAKYIDSPTVESVLILGPQQEVLLRTGEYGVFDNMSAAHFMQTIRGIEDSSGSFFQDEVLYTYLKTSFDRTYISMIPQKEIVSSISWIRSFVIITVTFFFVLSILLTLLTSINVYKPIRRLMHLGKSLNFSNAKSIHANEISFIEQCMSYLKQQSDQLIHDVDELKPVLKERFFQQLVEESYVNEKLIRSHHQIHEIMSHRSYLVLVVTIGDLHKDRRFSTNDRSIITFMMKNVMNELLVKVDRFQGEVIQDSQNRAVAVIFSDGEPSASELLDKVMEYGQLIVESIQHYLKLSAFVGIGRVHSSFTDISSSYREALLALQNRTYLESVSVINAEEAQPVRKHGNYYYPSHLKQSVVTALLNGDLSTSKANLSEYVRALRASESYTVITHGYFTLLHALMESLEQQDTVAYMELIEHDLIGQLKERQTPGEVYDWYVYELFPLFQQILNRKSNVASAIQLVVQYIHNHIYDDILLTHIAEIVDMSPSYLSRLFKKEKGVQFLEYVQECKIKEASRLMDETGMTIGEIASKIGYSERNLTRMFQKHTHMTPGQYRTKQREFVK